MKAKSNHYAIKSAISLLLISGLGFAYADDAESFCQNSDSIASRGTPNFLSSGPVGCDALKTEPNTTSLYTYCHNEQLAPHPPYPNCSVTHYGWDSLSSPPENVVQCSVDGEVRFKYVLCGYHGNHKWKLMIESTIQDIPDSIKQPE